MSARFEPLTAAIKICIICQLLGVTNHRRGHRTAPHHEESDTAFCNAPRSCHSSTGRAQPIPFFLAQMFTLLGSGKSPNKVRTCRQTLQAKERSPSRAVAGRLGSIKFDKSSIVLLSGILLPAASMTTLCSIVSARPLNQRKMKRTGK